MPPTAADLLTAALALPEAERQTLAHALLDSLGPPDDETEELTETEFETELKRRMEESDRDPSVRIPWEQVREMR